MAQPEKQAATDIQPAITCIINALALDDEKMRALALIAEGMKIEKELLAASAS